MKEEKWWHFFTSSIFISVAMFACILCYSCRKRQKIYLAKANGEEIAAEEFMEFYKSRPRVADWSSAQGRLDPNSVLNALIDKLLMSQRAKRMKLDNSPAFQDQIDRFREKEMVNIFLEKAFDPRIHISDEEVERSIPHYQLKEVRFARICVLTEDEAWRIKKGLDQGGDFSKIAKEKSIGIDAPRGGEGDFLSPLRGIYPKEVIEAIFNLPMGKISAPQKIREGYALFKPIEERPLNEAERGQFLTYHRELLFREGKNRLIKDLIEKVKAERGVTIDKDVIREARNQQSPSYNPTLARGEGIELRLGDLRQGLSNTGKEMSPLMKDPNILLRFAETKLNQRLLVLAAQNTEYANAPDLEKEVERFRQDLLSRQLMLMEVESKVVVEDEECRRYYQENLPLYYGAEMVKLSHILIKDEGKAKEILARIRKGEEFAALAKEHSEYKATSRRGGDMGYITIGESGMGYEFEQAVSFLRKGDISDLVKTPFGYQIINVIDRKPAYTQTFEEVREKIRQELAAKKRKTLFDQFLQSLRDKADIDINKGAWQDLRSRLGQGG